MDNNATRGNQANRIKSLQAIAAVEKAMKNFGIPKPPKGQRSRLHHDLPNTPEEKAAEVLRRFKYSNLHSKAVNGIAQKLNDLLVYAETGKALKSDLIALAVLSRLESFEKEVNEAQRAVLMTQKDLLSRRNFSREYEHHLIRRNEATKKRDRKVVENLKLYEEKGFLRRLAIPLSQHNTLFANSAQPIKRPKQFLKSLSWRDINLYSVDINEKVREDIDRYKQIGIAKKQLYSMPEYFHDKERRGIKLPVNKIKGQSADKNVSYVRDNNTTVGRFVAREILELKKMETLKQKLNPLQYRPASI